MFEFFKKSRGVLGMNARNLDYIRPYNKKRGMRIADQKLLCKQILKKNLLSVPALIAKVRTHEELEHFQWETLPESFALKPNRGFGGEGILVVYARKKPARTATFWNPSGEKLLINGNDPGSTAPDKQNVASGNRDLAWIKADGSLVTIEDLQNHIRNILDGSFSLSNLPDVAFFEERLKLLKLFKPYSYKGIPDVRIIVFNRVPVMAMLRLPTRSSDGKANLQLGAIGIGIDMATGTTTTAILGKSHLIEYLPGTRLILSGIKVPYWQEILKMAVTAQEISHLGFLGADIAIDRDRGPVILELNARPGLSIQLANLSGLKDRLERVRGLKIKTVERGIRVGMSVFGGEIEEEIEELSGKRVIGTVEKVKLVGKDGQEVEVEAKIDTGAYSSSIDTELAKKLGYEKTLEEFQKVSLENYQVTPENEATIKKEIFEKSKTLIPDLVDIAVVFSASGISIRPVVRVPFILDNTEIPASCNIVERVHLKYPMIIGKRNLSRFLVDASKS